MEWKIGQVLKPDLNTASQTHHTHHHIDSLAYHSQGEHLLAASSHASRLFLVNALTGTLEKTVNSQRVGCRLAQFTHHPQCVLFASSGDRVPGVVQLLSFHDNVVLRQYSTGVEGELDSLSMNPVSDIFMTCGVTGLRLFDLASPSTKPIAEMRLPTAGSGVLSAFDPQGLVFAVCRDDRLLMLYDVSRCQSGPFATFDLVDPYGCTGTWTQLRFSPDGKLILVNDTKNSLLHIIDSFEGVCKTTIKYCQQAANHRFTADWSHDSAMVVVGDEQGNRVNWFAVGEGKGRLVKSLEGHTSYPSMVAVNPRRHTFASACSNIALWLPCL